MDKLKDKIVDKIIDEVMNVVMGVSKKDVQEWIDKNKKQKILLRSIEKFHESDMFKREFKNVGYELDKDKIYSLPDNSLEASLTVDEIKKNIRDVISSCFGCEDGVKDRIIEFISIDYLQRAKATAEIYDVIRNQQKYYNELETSISDVKEIIVQNAKRVEKLERENKVY